MLKGADSPDTTCKYSCEVGIFASRHLTVFNRRRQLRLLVYHRDQRRCDLHLPTTTAGPPLQTIPLSQFRHVRKGELPSPVSFIQHLSTKEQSLFGATEEPSNSFGK